MADCWKAMRCRFEMVRSNRTEGIIQMRKRGSLCRATVLLHNMDFREFVRVRIEFVVYAVRFLV